MILVKAWLLAFRPKTLTAALVPIMVGTALVYAYDFPIFWSYSIYALLSALFIQIGTNLVNDASDFKKGADNEKRIGPKRIMQSGLFTHQRVMQVAGLMFVLALVCGVPLVLRGQWVILIIGVFSILCGYAYTSGPFPLAYKGLGDLFVIIFFGVIAVSGMFYIHVLHWPFMPMLAGLQIGLLATALIAINNLRDYHGDKEVGKKTLAVRLGISAARFEIALCIYLPFFLNLFWLVFNWWQAVFLPFLIFPFSHKLVKNVFTNPPSPVYNRYLGQAALIHLLFGLLFITGLVLK